MKKTGIALALLIFTNSVAFGANIPKEYDWAKDAVKYCTDKKIMNGVSSDDLALGNNLTREQMAKLLVEAFDKMPEQSQGENLTETDAETEEKPEPTFTDVPEDRWSYEYIESFIPYMKVKDKKFSPEEFVTREEFAASLVLISGYKEGNVLNRDILAVNFDDYKDVSEKYEKLLCIAVEKGYMKGDNGKIRPGDLLTRAQTCVFIHRVLESKAGKIKLDLGVRKIDEPIVGESTVTLEQAKAWAEGRGAHQRFIDIADIYWQYGELTGIRPEILYAQAAKETGFGKYGGAVLPEQNNWAGIKTAKATGDLTEDHETFETPDDGVRGHFNHICAYIGEEPTGEPHGRYFNVKSIAWAGTVKNLDELGGKWCPDLYYGYSIYYNYLKPMQETEI